MATPKPFVLLQERCLLHRYIRSRDVSTIVERPERLCAINVGLATAVARVEHARRNPESTKDTLSGQTDALADALSKLGLVESIPAPRTVESTNDLVASLDKLSITKSNSDSHESERGSTNPVVQFVSSVAMVDLCTHPAVDYIHGDENPDNNPLRKLRNWVHACEARLKNKESEVPPHLPQGDLYLCPQSLEAISSAAGTVCEATDLVAERARANSSTCKDDRRAFAAIRPPGHHADEANPMGFCWVNNVAIAAAHAHLKHGISHVVVLDIDLHHGNGTQNIIWRINEDAYRQELESDAAVEAGQQPKPSPLRFYYGSIHDILSYPCEDGKPSLVAAASVKISGAHGQYIENIHLEPYQTMDEFWKLYDGPYARLLGQAEHFCKTTNAKPENTMVFISCGFDANELEYASMSRHGRYVPPAFYAQFTRDAVKFADRYADGKLVSVLEGGYSDRALASGALAHIVGMTSPVPLAHENEWWTPDNLVKMEKATARKGRKSRTSQGLSEPWLDRAVDIFNTINARPPPAPNHVEAPTRVLRERPPRATGGPPTSKGKPVSKAAPTSAPQGTESDSPLTDASSSDEEPPQVPAVTARKLPRVILHVNPRSVA